MSTEEMLEQAKLRYTSDDKPGYTRKIIGEQFVYFDTDGKKITDQATIDRINKLVIPPAYTKVWICPKKNGHLQATGYDKRGRKQYRYHPLWTVVSQEKKFSHLTEFAKYLPKIRGQVQKDLAKPGMPREKVLAAVVWLLENTLIRVGNEEYEKENKSYGLTTLKNKHTTVDNMNNIRFEFKGKSGVHHLVKIKSKKVASVIRKCRDLPGQDLFEYRDEKGEVQTVTSSDVNDYVKTISGIDITAKDFRTWGGTILAATAFNKCDICDDEKLSKQQIVETVKKVSSHLRNRPATCRKYYIHPAIIDAYTNGYVLSNIEEKIKKKKFQEIDGLDDCENKVLLLLESMLAIDKKELK
jgi:DNA topoisomerase I